MLVFGYAVDGNMARIEAGDGIWLYRPAEIGKQIRAFRE
jgi:hypothetical protein